MQKKINNFEIKVKTGYLTINNVDATIKRLTVGSENTSFSQICALSNIVSFRHLFFALEQALDATEKKSSFSKNPALEFLLRAHATKQISEALKLGVLKKGKNEVALLVVAKEKKNAEEIFLKLEKELCFEEKDLLKEISEEKKKRLMKTFRITEKMLSAFSDENALEELVFEKVALTALKN